MSWDLAKARARIGLAEDDNTRDQQLQEAMDIALAAAESYCDRRFLQEEDEEEFTVPIYCQILVRRYPLVALLGISPLDNGGATINPPLPPDPAPTQWRMDRKRGIVFIVGQPPWTYPSGYTGGARVGFTLHFVGGYDPLPADLEAALWMIFDSVWASTPGYGPAAGAAPSEAPVKSFAIDGMAISYDYSSSSSQSGSVEAYGVLPGRAVGILDSYRAESAALGG